MMVQVQGRTEQQDTRSHHAIQKGRPCETYNPFISETFHLRFLGPSHLTAAIESKSSEKVGLLCTSEKGHINVATSSNVKPRSSHLEGHPGRVFHKYWYKVTKGKHTRVLTAAVHRESKPLGTTRCPWQTDPRTLNLQHEQNEGGMHTLAGRDPSDKVGGKKQSGRQAIYYAMF